MYGAKISIAVGTGVELNTENPSLGTSIIMTGVQNVHALVDIT